MARLKVGSYVVLSDGSVGIIFTMGGQTEARAVMVGPDGKEETKPEVPEGAAIVHLLDEKGETLMVKHPTLMKFISADVVVPLAELKSCPVERIPASRQSQQQA